MFALFNAIDSACGALPVAVRMVLYGLLLGLVAMLIYWLTSPQRRLVALKQEIADAQCALRAYKGTDGRQVLRLSVRTVMPAVKQLLFVLVPTIIAMAPVLLVALWIESAYAHRLPSAGDSITVTISDTTSAADRTVRWMPADAVRENLTAGRYIIRWPSHDEPITLVDARIGSEILRLPLRHPDSTIGHRQWWSGPLEGSDRDELPEESPLSTVQFDLPARWMWSIGPMWMRSWEVPFLAALSVAALVMKFTLKIV